MLYLMTLQIEMGVVFFLVRFKAFKGTDRLCKVVELSMQCSGQLL